MNIRIPSFTLCTAISLGALFASSFVAVQAKNSEPFTGEWVSKQYTNGKEFHLKIQQDKDEIVGWEGRLPPQQLPEPDFSGKIDGKEAEIEVTHRRGYKAHVKLSIRGDRLVWQLIDATGRSSRYFPLASTLVKQSDSIAADKFQTLPYTNPAPTDAAAQGANSAVLPVSTATTDSAQSPPAPETASPTPAPATNNGSADTGSSATESATTGSAGTGSAGFQPASNSPSSAPQPEAPASKVSEPSSASAASGETSPDSPEPKVAPDYRKKNDSQ